MRELFSDGLKACDYDLVITTSAHAQTFDRFFFFFFFFLPTSWTIGLMSRLKTFKYHENVYMLRDRLAHKILLQRMN